MITNIEFQKQHRVSQVYLKQFGFLKEGEWHISVWRKFIHHTDIKPIRTFLTEINVFDLPFEDFKDRRHFENTSNIIEREYPKIINSLLYQHKLLPKHRYLLCHYAANLICRTNPYRQFFNRLLYNATTRNKFLEEITMFKEPEELVNLKNLLNNLHKDFQLNVVMGY